MQAGSGSWWEAQTEQLSASRRVYVDLDDVLAETGRAFLEVLERHFDRRVAFDEIHHFDLGRSFGLTPDELAEFMRRAHEPEVLESVTLVPGALEVLASWVEAGLEIDVVTGRPPSTEGVSRRWLAATGMPHRDLRFIDKYSHSEKGFMEGPSATPLNQLSRNDYAVAVEDSAKVGIFLAREVGIPVVLLDRPWNRRVEIPDDLDGRLERCRDWGEIAGLAIGE